MAKGIIIEFDGDLMVQNGSLVIGETKYQNQYHLLYAHQGEIKEHPALGVGIESMLNDDDSVYWRKEIITGLAADGVKVSKLDISSTGFNLETE